MLYADNECQLCYNAHTNYIRTHARITELERYTHDIVVLHFFLYISEGHSVSQLIGGPSVAVAYRGVYITPVPSNLYWTGDYNSIPAKWSGEFLPGSPGPWLQMQFNLRGYFTTLPKINNEWYCGRPIVLFCSGPTQILFLQNQQQQRGVGVF